jgi:thiol-disulfide isomerase/thioredoxin
MGQQEKGKKKKSPYPHLDDVLQQSKVFDKVKAEGDVDGMMKVISNLRIMHGKMEVKRYLILSKLGDEQKALVKGTPATASSSKLDSAQKTSMYELSVYDSIVESVKKVIRDYETTLREYIIQANANMGSPSAPSTRDDRRDSIFTEIDEGLPLDDAADPATEEILSGSKFDPSIPSLTLYFSHGCGHCRDFMPAWKAFRKLCKGKRIYCMTIDCEKNPDLCQDAGIIGYPTVMFNQTINEKMISEEYSGARTTDALVAYMEKKAGVQF